MCDGCTRREFLERQREASDQIAGLIVRFRFWHPWEGKRIKQEVRRIHAAAERDYAGHMVRDGEGRLVFRCTRLGADI